MPVAARTVLVIDDNEDTLELMSDALCDDALRVLCAHSGTDAISLLMSESVDLVLLDLMMPDMNGFAVLEVMRFVPRLMQIPVLVCTAQTGRHDTERARELGAAGVLFKPLSPTDVRQQVEQQLAVVVGG